ncbi:methionine--tRNA ligase [Patescibacteria group bacterium]|nr:MAG: methionine--tRNA ligase [Patescibacteria group bacterium]
MTKEKQKFFIGNAWPYANGSLHLGHLAGLIGGDVLARYFRMSEGDVLFVSGSDCHGTPITVEADKLGVHPSEIAEKYHKEFADTLINGLNFSYDIYTKTTTENHTKTVQDIFLKLYNSGMIYKKEVELAYCEKDKRFLPDRYVEGECPICHFANARGDQCDNCGNILDAKDLVKPRCKLCGTAPIWKPSEHFFLKLSAFEKELSEWINESAGWRVNAKNSSLKILEQGLIDRAVTRDTEWGVEIPMPGYESKRIYVWFEAVCGYLSASKEWAKNQGKENIWEEFWKADDTRHYYVHGKDNIIFHTIIWPAMLIAYDKNLRLPDCIVSSEYLTLEGKQFSKSRHWAVWIPDFLKKFDADTLRYHMIMAGPETADADFSWEEYQKRVNSELIGTFGNFVNRVLAFIKNNFPEGVRMPKKINKEQREFLDRARKCFDLAGEAIAQARFREGLREIFALVEHGNRYINSAAPWTAIKTSREQAENDLAVAGQVIRCLAILFRPYLPKTAENIGKMFAKAAPKDLWQYPEPVDFLVGDIVPLYRKIENEEINEQIGLLRK